MLTICSMSVNCRQIRSERDCLLSMFSDTSVWNNNVHRLKLLDLKQLHFVLYMGVFVFWVNKITQVNMNISLFIWQTEIYTRWSHCISLLSLSERKGNAHTAANHKENNTLWHTSEQCTPNILKSWCTVSTWYQVHQQAGCILVRMKCWLSTEFPSKAAAPSSA